jgi:hypothetical protein
MESHRNDSGGLVSIKRDIEYAIYIHGVWKTRFRNFLSGRAPMDISSVGRADCCKLGQWLDNEARRMLSPADHSEAHRLHTHFHAVCGSIVDNIKRRDFGQAREALVTDGAFDEASHSLAAFLRRMPLHLKSQADSPRASPETGACEATA